MLFVTGLFIKRIVLLELALLKRLDPLLQRSGLFIVGNNTLIGQVNFFIQPFTGGLGGVIRLSAYPQHIGAGGGFHCAVAAALM